MDEGQTLNNNQAISDGDTGSFLKGKDQETPSEMRQRKLVERYGSLHAQTASVFSDLFRAMALSQTCDAISLHQSNTNWNLPVHKFKFFSIAGCSYLAIDKEKYESFFLELFGLTQEQSPRLSELCSKYQEITLPERVLILASELGVNLTLFHISSDGGLHSVSQSYKPDRTEAIVAIDDQDMIFRIVPQVIVINAQYIIDIFEKAPQVQFEVASSDTSNSNQKDAEPTSTSSPDLNAASSGTPSEDTNKDEKIIPESNELTKASCLISEAQVEGDKVRFWLHSLFYLILYSFHSVCVPIATQQQSLGRP